MKKPRYTYYAPEGQESFSSIVRIDNSAGYLLRRNSFGLWATVYLTAGIKGRVLNAKDADFDRFVRSGVWVKAAPKLARRAAQLNKTR